MEMSAPRDTSRMKTANSMKVGCAGRSNTSRPRDVRSRWIASGSASPDARERVRPTIPGEFWDMPDFKGMTRVMQLAPGARTRTTIEPTKQDLEESERLSRWMSLMHNAEDGLQ